MKRDPRLTYVTITSMGTVTIVPHDDPAAIGFLGRPLREGELARPSLVDGWLGETWKLPMDDTGETVVVCVDRTLPFYHSPVSRSPIEETTDDSPIPDWSLGNDPWAVRIVDDLVRQRMRRYEPTDADVERALRAHFPKRARRIDDGDLLSGWTGGDRLKMRAALIAFLRGAGQT